MGQGHLAFALQLVTMEAGSHVLTKSTITVPNLSPNDNLLPTPAPPPDPTWRTHPPTMTALSATATSLGAKVRPAACAATGTCLPGSEIMPGAGAGAGSGPTAGQAALITPGAALAAIPGEAGGMAPGLLM
jgi:hypothetical protein